MRIFRRALIAVFLPVFVFTVNGTAQAQQLNASIPQAQDALQIYFVDVEGGQATLFVTPAGQSLLIDTGWPGQDGRDSNRIVAAARKAGNSKIDFVLLTHFHQDHAGGITQLAARIPVGAVIDHGENRERSDATTEQVWLDYQRLLAKGNIKRIIAKPGDDLPIRGIQAKVVSSDGAAPSSKVLCVELAEQIRHVRRRVRTPPIRRKIYAP